VLKPGYGSARHDHGPREPINPGGTNSLRTGRISGKIIFLGGRFFPEVSLAYAQDYRTIPIGVKIASGPDLTASPTLLVAADEVIE
jgi:hypothetical protein